MLEALHLMFNGEKSSFSPIRRVCEGITAARTVCEFLIFSNIASAAAARTTKNASIPLTRRCRRYGERAKLDSAEKLTVHEKSSAKAAPSGIYKDLKAAAFHLFPLCVRHYFTHATLFYSFFFLVLSLLSFFYFFRLLQLDCRTDCTRWRTSSSAARKRRKTFASQSRRKQARERERWAHSFPQLLNFFNFPQRGKQHFFSSKIPPPPFSLQWSWAPLENSSQKR